MRTQISSIEMSVYFEEESIPAVEIGESSSPPPPLIVSEDSNNFFYSNMSCNEYLISYPNTTKIPKWE